MFRDSVASRGYKWRFTVLSDHPDSFVSPWNPKMPASVNHREESQPRTLTLKKAASKPPSLTSNTATGCSRHDRSLYFHFRWLTLAFPLGRWTVQWFQDKWLNVATEFSSKSKSGTLLSSYSVWFLLISDILPNVTSEPRWGHVYKHGGQQRKTNAFLMLKFSQGRQNWAERMAFP